MAQVDGNSQERPWESDPLYLPFKRQDYYGVLGLRPLSLLEKLRLAFLACCLVPIKLLGALCCLVAYYCICRLSLLLPRSVKTDFIAAAGKVACRSCLFCLGFYKVEWIQVEHGQKHGRRSNPVVIVSNHCGWSDILVHMSRSFPAFVARDATKATPLIGLIRCSPMSAVMASPGRPALSLLSSSLLLRQHAASAFQWLSARRPHSASLAAAAS
jgi:hypothetical protein